MWFERFLRIISEIIPVDPESRLPPELAQLNPDKIYLENVRSILRVSSRTAERVLETAVRQGVLRKRVEVICPDGAVAASADSEQALPATVHCWQADEEEIEIPTVELKKITFYKLNDKSETAAAASV